MKLSREWATPLTIGVFGLMTITGILMFFHWDTGLNKTAHEWLGWLMVVGVAAHAAVNWPGFRRYLLSSTKGRAIIVASLLVTAGSFLSLSGQGQEGLPPPVMALKAVTNAPLTMVAGLSGKSVDQLMDQLNQAGIPVASSDASISSVIAGDRGLEGKAIRVIFSRSH